MLAARSGKKRTSMANKKAPMTQAERAKMLGELRRDVAQRKSSYRVRALKMYPHICASCGREFEGKRLKELTVHHKDHNHDNNSSDGSNWELLCLYCHDHEHEKQKDGKYMNAGSASVQFEESGFGNPFDNLDSMMEQDEN